MKLVADKQIVSFLTVIAVLEWQPYKHIHKRAEGTAAFYRRTAGAQFHPGPQMESVAVRLRRERSGEPRQLIFTARRIGCRDAGRLQPEKAAAGRRLPSGREVCVAIRCSSAILHVTTK